MAGWVQVSTAAELTEALDAGNLQVEVIGEIGGMPSLRLPPGVQLRGGVLAFKAKGLCLSADNAITDVRITTAVTEPAIYNDTTVTEMGTLVLSNVTTVGQIYLTADGSIRSGMISAENVWVESADVRGRFDRPHGFGVDALQGAFTVWNRQADPAVRINARLTNISVGTDTSPVRGSGVFVGGHGDRSGHGDGGSLEIDLLTTGDIFTDGGIPSGTPDLISGGVFVISGANVDEVVNVGSVTTHGQNDMVLDNWGVVRTWTAKAPVISRGPSGIGFVNFGSLDSLTVEAPIETFGLGARGFNVYDGTMQRASFRSITTHGDGSVGIQVSRDLPELVVTGDVATRGGTGQSLVKGVLVDLAAVALSIKPGGRIGNAHIGGDIATAGDRVTTLEVEGEIGALTVDGVIRAEGADAVGVRQSADQLDTEALRISVPHGTPVA